MENFGKRMTPKVSAKYFKIGKSTLFIKWQGEAKSQE